MLEIVSRESTLFQVFVSFFHAFPSSTLIFVGRCATNSFGFLFQPPIRVAAAMKPIVTRTARVPAVAAITPLMTTPVPVRTAAVAAAFLPIPTDTRNTRSLPLRTTINRAGEHQSDGTYFSIVLGRGEIGSSLVVE